MLYYFNTYKWLLFSTCIRSAMTADGLKFMMLHVDIMISAPEHTNYFSLLVFAYIILSKREQLWTIRTILYLIASYNVDYIQQRWLKSIVSLQTLP